MFKNLKIFILVWTLGTIWLPCFGITPEEVGVLGCQSHSESRLVVKLYTQHRSIPQENIFWLNCRGETTLTKSEYEGIIKRPVKNFLALNPRIKYLVTTRGMPFRISANRPDQDPEKIDQHFKSSASSLESELSILGMTHPPEVGWVELPPKPPGNEAKVGFPIVMRMDGNSIVSIQNSLAAQKILEDSGAVGEFCVDTTLKNSHLENSPLFSLLSEWEQNMRNKTLLLVLKGLPKKEVNCSEGILVWGPLGNVSGWAIPNSAAIWWTWESLDTKSPSRDSIHYLNSAFYPFTAWPTYIESYPEVTPLLSLLFTGKFSLGEALHFISYRASWMVSMIGDPMYTPFKMTPQMNLEQAESYLGFPFALSKPKLNQKP